MDDLNQWDFPLDSASSEGWNAEINAGGYMTDFTGASSSTSWDAPLHDPLDSTFYATESSGQLTAHPIQYEDDASNMERDLPFKEIPQYLDLPGFPEPNISPQAAQFLSGHSSELDRIAMGIPDPRPFSMQPPLAEFGDQMVRAFAACKNRMSAKSYPQDEVSEVLETLRIMTTFFTSKLSPSPASPSPASPSSASPDKPVCQARVRFQCYLCEDKANPKMYTAFNTLKRHLSTTHRISSEQWHCSRCKTITFRRDRMREHFIYHHRFDITSAELEQTRSPLPAPDSCPICSKPVVAEWDEIFKHIRENCSSPRPEAVPTNGNQSRRGSDGRGSVGTGNGHSQCHGYGSFTAEASHHSGQLPSYLDESWNQSNNQRGYNPYPDAHYEDPGSISNAEPGSALHSVIDGQLNLGHHQRSTNVIGKLPMNDLPSRSVESRAHLPGGVDKQPRKLQPPHTPGNSRSGQSSQKRKRPRKEKEPTQQNEPDPRACEQCSHIMTRCEECSTVRGCHICGPGPSGGAIEAGNTSGMLVRGYLSPSSAVTTLNPTYLDFQNMLEPSGLMPTQPSYHPTGGATQQFWTQTPYQSFQSMTDTLVGDSFPGDQFMTIAQVAGGHEVLRGLNGKIQESSVVECDTRLLRSIGLDSFICSSQVKGQTKQLQPEAAVVLTPSLYTDFVLRSKASSGISNAPQPALFQCQCACITKPLLSRECRAVFQLSPNEWVDMTFKISPAHETSHPLRTRIQIFAKLLKLRTAAAQSTTQKQRRRSIESVSKCEDLDDTDSDQGLLATSPSGSELTPVSYWTEEVQDWSFNFDINWAALANLAQWAGGIDADTCQNLLLSDHGHVLDLIAMYIKCKFEIYWLLMGSSGLSLLLSI
ncbi:uncharacterized protein N7515_008011 [Penicillium bovifimosum]|uniref:C2H2-type domain-containing protein n=1 Tax=Penicillium bovifimosum TaxID=126998 RepID=A0A9W9GM98_9EURO|nr:uncharacterized protein N7515_008011 [Penicillium bovifimosum]KAJ5124186.1 hypothetical protein N7515_008011 [Penicillium bovifimosum]